MQPVKTGFIKKLVSDKGFGFIRRDDSGEDIFFHASGVAEPARFDDICENQLVTFLEETDREGRSKAVSVIVEYAPINY